jgi:hypothetical protein
MASKDDITDEFDDDSLRNSIEKAGSYGQWRENAPFADPKYEAIRKQLEDPQRETYAERRKRELQQRAAASTTVAGKPQSVQPTTQPDNALAAVFADDTAPSPAVWGEQGAASPEFVEPHSEGATGGPPSAAAPPQAVPPTDQFAQPAPQPKYVAVRSPNPVAEQLRPVLVGFSVFGPVALLQVLLTAWRWDVLLRLVMASVFAGVGWQKYEADRYRSALIGAGVYLLAFTLTWASWTTRDIIAVSLGFVASVIGSGLVGMIRETQDGPISGGR